MQIQIPPVLLMTRNRNHNTDKKTRLYTSRTPKLLSLVYKPLPVWQVLSLPLHIFHIIARVRKIVPICFNLHETRKEKR